MEFGADFSESQYAAVTDALRAGLDEVSRRLDGVAAAARASAARPIVPPPLAAAMVLAGDRIVGAVGVVRDMIVDALRGVGAPVLVLLDGLDWLEVKGAATRVQGVLRADQLPVGDHWKGYAAQRYAVAVRGQAEAAGRIGATADRASSALITCSVAGLAFYTALGVVVARLIVALAAAIAAFGSVAFSWAGVLLVLEEAGVGAAVVTGLVAALTALLGAQVTQLGGLTGELADGGVFHEGHWPSATTTAYADATVTDGDAEWSFGR
jgi:hypothetical protein